MEIFNYFLIPPHKLKYLKTPSCFGVENIKKMGIKVEEPPKEPPVKVGFANMKAQVSGHSVLDILQN
ncbi:hypothetical protein SESBI_04176 [Sesbania bispinosa]|nr:hypothetical protein SESBI_04176 [Sesbania bispinosa]